MPVFLRSDAARRPLAVTAGGETRLSPDLAAHPDRPHVLAHEAAHRAQFQAQSQPTGTRAALEADAERGARALRSGQEYTPRVAAPPGMVLSWPPDAAEPWFPDPQRQGEREQDALVTAGLAGPESQVAITTTSEGGGLSGSQSFEYVVNVEASERTGSILSTTGIRVVHERDPWVSVAGQPTIALDLETGLAPTHLEPAYPYAIHYTRMITYTDSDGRTAEVDIEGHVHFTEETWRRQVGGVLQPSFEELLRLRGDEGSVVASLHGQSSITGYYASYAAAGVSVDLQTSGAVQLLGISGGLSLISPSSPASFLDPRVPVGEQFLSLRMFLLSVDARELARRLAQQSGATSSEPSWLEDLASGLAELLGPLFEGLPDLGDLDILPDWLDEWLQDVGEDIASALASVLGPVVDFLDSVGAAIGEWWDSLPPWARGVLTAVGKFVAALGALAAVAGLVVLAAEGAIAFGTAMLVVGAIALAGTFVYSLYQRSVEAYVAGDPLAFFDVPFVAFLDAVGLSGVIEAITDRSLLTGIEYNRSEEERWEAGTSGALQLIGIFFMVRGARGGGPRGEVVTPEVRGPMGDFHALPPERLPVLPEGHSWVRSRSGEWTILRDPTAPEVPVEISIYSDGQGRIHFNIRSGTETLQSEAMTRPGNDTFSGGDRLPPELSGTGPDNPFRDLTTNRSFDKGHGVDYADALEGPGVRSSNLDPANFTPQAAWWNRWVRNHLVARIRARSGGYREMPVYDQSPTLTQNGTPIPREFVFVETNGAGQPVRAWRIPNDPTLTGRSQSVLGQYEIPLSDIPEVMILPDGAMRAPGTLVGPAVIGGERGQDEAP